MTRRRRLPAAAVAALGLAALAAGCADDARPAPGSGGTGGPAVEAPPPPAAPTAPAPEAGLDASAAADAPAPGADKGPAIDGPDAAPPGDAPGAGGLPGPAAAPCTVGPLAVACAHETTPLWTGLELREVHWQVPGGAPPAAGWPAVLLFQGSFVPAGLFWAGAAGEPGGGFHQARLVAELLARGYAVLTPEAHLGGAGAWDTNVPPFAVAWATSPDHRLVTALLDGLADGAFGPLDPARLYAAGISSGGYMTSRMAVSYPGRFRALVVHAGSYATCAGAACLVPPLAADHPPTRFVHGALDPVVPLWTMELYAAALAAAGVEADRVVAPLGAHAWLPEAPAATADWLDAHP